MFEFCWFSTAAIDWKSTKGNNNLALMKPQYPKNAKNFVSNSLSWKCTFIVLSKWDKFKLSTNKQNRSPSSELKPYYVFLVFFLFVWLFVFIVFFKLTSWRIWKRKKKKIGLWLEIKKNNKTGFRSEELVIQEPFSIYAHCLLDCNTQTQHTLQFGRQLITWQGRKKILRWNYKIMDFSIDFSCASFNNIEEIVVYLSLFS